MKYIIEEVDNGFKLWYEERHTDGHAFFPEYRELVFEFEPENNVSERKAFNRLVSELRQILGLGLYDAA